MYRQFLLVVGLGSASTTKTGAQRSILTLRDTGINDFNRWIDAPAPGTRGRTGSRPDWCKFRSSVAPLCLVKGLIIDAKARLLICNLILQMCQNHLGIAPILSVMPAIGAITPDVRSAACATLNLIKPDYTAKYEQYHKFSYETVG